MKIRFTIRVPGEDVDLAVHEYSAEIDVKSWDDAFKKGREFRRLVDGLGMGSNAEQDEMLGYRDLP